MQKQKHKGKNPSNGHLFKYIDDTLYCEDIDLSILAKKYGTPLYVYSKNTLLENYNLLKNSFEKRQINNKICYAVKANSNINLLRELVKVDSYFDIVSAGELYRVIKAGGSGHHCVFAGIGKTTDEIQYAIDNDIKSFNVESFDELEEINKIAKKNNKVAPISLRVNPNVDAQTHKHISTGKDENKFGININEAHEKIANYVEKLKNIKLIGIQSHIGSQITKTKPFIDALEILTPIAKKWQDNFNIQHISIGGGLGIAYEHCLESADKKWIEKNSKENETIPPTYDEYAEIVSKYINKLDIDLIMEPGRSLVGNAGVLISKLIYDKHTKNRNFKIVDAAMNDLIRPALYDGFHQIIPVKKNQSEKKISADVVGPVCESGDTFCKQREIADIGKGEYYAIMSAGAYGFTMASNYNSRPLPAEILVNGDLYEVIRRRQSLKDLISLEI